MAVPASFTASLIGNPLLQIDIINSDLMNNLEKEGIQITESDVNKILLDLEIFGLIRVNWVSKDKRRIEVVSVSKEDLV